MDTGTHEWFEDRGLTRVTSPSDPKQAKNPANKPPTKSEKEKPATQDDETIDPLAE